MIRTWRLAMRGLLIAASAIVCGNTAAAQAGPCPVPARDSVRVWTPPLDRVVTLASSGGSLRTAQDLVAAVIAGAVRPAERVLLERSDGADLAQDLHRLTRDADGATAVVEGRLVVEQNTRDTVLGQCQRCRHADRPGADNGSAHASASAGQLGHVARLEARIVEIEGVERAAPCRSHDDVAPLDRRSILRGRRSSSRAT